MVAWGGTAGGPPQRARLVLVPRGLQPPPLTGDLTGASLIRTPVMRIAVNDQPQEAIIRALGLEDRLVAVGGHKSYGDGSAPATPPASLCAASSSTPPPGRSRSWGGPASPPRRAAG